MQSPYLGMPSLSVEMWAPPVLKSPLFFVPIFVSSFSDFYEHFSSFFLAFLTPFFVWY